MSLFIEQRDILSVADEGKDAIIVQQVNCQGVMGAGLAKQIRDRWPEVFERYHAKCEMGVKLGDVQFVCVSGDEDRDSGTPGTVYVANLFAQDHYQPRGVCHTDYPALRKGLRACAAFERAHGHDVYIPWHLGCGLAGGDWVKVSTLVEMELRYAIICQRAQDKS